jgi:hypothetical protein
MPEWHTNNLDEHVDKRARRDGACWPDILGSGVPLTRKSLADATRRAWGHYGIEVEHDSTLGIDKRSTRCVSRVDRRALRVVATGDMTTFKTCYHLHAIAGRHQSTVSFPPRQILELFRARLGQSCATMTESNHIPRIEELEWRTPA